MSDYLDNPLLKAISVAKSNAKQKLATSVGYAKKSYELRYHAAEKDYEIVRKIMDSYTTRRIGNTEDNPTYSPLVRHMRNVKDTTADKLRKLDPADRSWKYKYYTERYVNTVYDLSIIEALEIKYCK